MIPLLVIALILALVGLTTAAKFLLIIALLIVLAAVIL
jgi:hypothetical protein